jgi:enoyl-CoA hydratase/carnithine racemase
MTEYQEILYRVDKRVAFITFNRPQVHNAMSRRLRDEAVDALKKAEADDQVSVIVIEAPARLSAAATMSERRTMTARRMPFRPCSMIGPTRWRAASCAIGSPFGIS